MQNCPLEEAKESWISGLYHHVFLYLTFTLAPLAWITWTCLGNDGVVRAPTPSGSRILESTLPWVQHVHYPCNVLTPLNWDCSLPWNRKSCLGERGITPFRNTSHPARAEKEKCGGKKKRNHGRLPTALQYKGISCSFWDPYGKLKMNWFALWIFNSEAKQPHVLKKIVEWEILTQICSSNRRRTTSHFPPFVSFPYLPSPS